MEGERKSDREKKQNDYNGLLDHLRNMFGSKPVNVESVKPSLTIINKVENSKSLNLELMGIFARPGILKYKANKIKNNEQQDDLEP